MPDVAKLRASGDVRGFLHVCCIGAYREVTWEIVHALLESRLYDRSAAIEVGVLGSPDDQQVIEEMLRPFDRFRIAYRSEDVSDYEFPTLGLLQDACRTWEGPVYYLHTKGVSYSPSNQYARSWRRLMLDEIVTGHERCLAGLADAETVGTRWSDDHYSGNFWWAQPSHIRRLPDIRELRHTPRPIALDDHADGNSIPGRGIGSVWNIRLQCEHWLTMVQARFRDVGIPGRFHLYRELCWTTSATDVIDQLLGAGGGSRFAGLDTEPPDGQFDVIALDVRDDPSRGLDLIERCLPKLSPDGAVLVRYTNPPSAWHQRPAAEFIPGTEWTGQTWRAVIEFRMRHPECEVFTVDTDWGCTVIRPGRMSRHRPDAVSAEGLDWATFVGRRRELLNLVDVPWFRRYLYAERYLNGSSSPATVTELINTVVAADGLDSYLRIGPADDKDAAHVIAPIRHRCTPDARAPLEHYDLVAVDEDQLDRALNLVSDRGSILVRGKPDSHPEFDCWTAELDEVYTLLHRRAPAGPTAREGAAPAAQSYAGNRELLLAAVELDPDDLRSTLHLADTYFEAGDFAAARRHYSRAVELRDWWWKDLDEAIFVAMMRIADSMTQLGEPWSEVRDAYLQAWEFQPDRIAPLYTIANRYRAERRYQLGYLYAKTASEIPPPEGDQPASRRQIQWRVRDELAVCASWTGRREEAFALWRELLGRTDLPPADRQRIAANRDACVPAMLEAASRYPEAVAHSLTGRPDDPRITVTLIAGPLRKPVEHTLNSFLNCCLDVSRVGRFLVIDTGLSAANRALLQQNYPFLEFAPPGLTDISALIDTRLWLHLGRDWRFFAPGNLITRLESVLDAHPEVTRVAVNPHGADGPAMFDTTRADAAAGAATLDEVVCTRQTLITIIGRGNSGTRAIARTLMHSDVFMGEPIKEDSADLVPAEDMYQACRIISRYIPWRGGLDWDFGPVQTMPIPAEFTGLIERYLNSVLSSPDPRAGWKLPETTLCYPWITRLFPDIRYIFWVRNPLDCMTNHHFTDDLRDFGIDYPPTDDPYLRRAISWKYQDDLVAATPPPRHLITVRLEDFVQQQHRELQRLEDYLGFGMERIPVRSDPVGRHQRTPGLPFPEFLEPAMPRHGYLSAPE